MKTLLKSSILLGTRRTPQVQIQSAGFYITVEGQPTECMFKCGADLVDLQITRDEAKIIGKWLLEQAAL
jgi:hypothetical protein